jgi:hypothetical protein
MIIIHFYTNRNDDEDDDDEYNLATKPTPAGQVSFLSISKKLPCCPVPFMLTWIDTGNIFYNLLAEIEGKNNIISWLNTTTKIRFSTKELNATESHLWNLFHEPNNNIQHPSYKCTSRVRYASQMETIRFTSTTQHKLNGRSFV